VGAGSGNAAWFQRGQRSVQHRGTGYNTGSMKVRDVIKRLEEDGWRLARTKGSHRQFHHPAKPGTVTVAGHPSVDIPPGTLNNILKQAGLK
jgi:predicted RNA binding protein YcfA (HicA-like mRNA interferase family)